MEFTYTETVCLELSDVGDKRHAALLRSASEADGWTLGITQQSFNILLIHLCGTHKLCKLSQRWRSLGYVQHLRPLARIKIKHGDT